MVAEIILVTAGEGTEAARQSAQYVARSLSAIGHKVREQISVCESVKQLQQAVAKALGRSHILVTLGGLGREAGYMAKTTVAGGLGLPLELDSQALDAMRAYCRRTGESYSLEDNELCKLPRGSVAFPGSYGKIPGYAVSSSKQHIVMLPENQTEIIPMFNKYVAPYLGGRATTTVTRTVRTYGVGEKSVRETLAGMMSAANPAVTVQREHNEVLVRVSAHAETAPRAAALCTPVLQTVVDKLGDAAYGLDVESLQSALIAKLQKKELDLSIAEAGTGGILTRVIAETEGGQDVLRYSVAVDEDEAKIQKLGLGKKPLRKKGGVSEYAAVEMAAAVRAKAHTSIGIAVTACTSEFETKKTPPGLVYIAVCNAEFVYVKKLVVGDGGALDDTIVDAALSRALNMSRLFVDYLPGKYPGAISLIEAMDGVTVTDRDRYVDEFSDDGSFEEDSGERKADKRDIVRKVVFTVALLVFIGSVGYLAYSAYQGYDAGRKQDALTSMFGEIAVEEIPSDYPYKNYKFAGLWMENPDVRGYINIPDTSVSYPVVQKYDNDYYLRRDFYGEHDQYGVPFFDYRVDVEKPSDNMVVYGHNMDPSGLLSSPKIFGELLRYKEVDFYREHPLIEFSTVHADGKYKVFSVFITNAYENQGHVFDYFNFVDAGSDKQFEDFLEQLRYRSIIDTPVDVKPGDELLTLSTCSYELKDMRTVIVARKVRRGEDEQVNVSAASENPNPLYPDIWYEKYGGEKPKDVNSDWAVGATALVGHLAGGAPGVVAASASVSQADESSINEWANERADKRRAEAARLAEESSQAAKETRMASEAAEASASQAEESRKAEEAEEASRQAEESQKAAEAEEASRLAEESRKAAEAEEAARLASEAAEESKRAEASRKAAEEAERLDAEAQSADRIPPADYSGESLTVNANGGKYTGDALEIVSQVVQNEVGASFHTEAIKAQAVATYSYIRHQNASGVTPSVYMNSSVSPKVQSAVSEVIGRGVYYNGGIAFTPYHATSAGATTSSATVWGGSYPYLTSVDSSPDTGMKYYRVETTMSGSEVGSRISSRLGITPSGDPGGWIEVVSRNDGGYIGDVRVCGQTKSSSGTKLNGRVLRETVLNLRSANFDIDYDSGADRFTFTTYGFGHGVGMSQTGANAYANQGWSYVDILTHYYPGTSVQ